MIQTRSKTACQKTNHLTRRQFLTRTTAVTAGLSASLDRSSFGASGAAQQSDPGRVDRARRDGSGHLHRLVDDPTVELLAVCDVDRTRREQANSRSMPPTRATGTPELRRFQ